MAEIVKYTVLVQSTQRRESMRPSAHYNAVVNMMLSFEKSRVLLALPCVTITVAIRLLAPRIYTFVAVASAFSTATVLPTLRTHTSKI